MTPKGCQLLIVEDEAIVREDLRDLLESLGYAVCGACSSAREARELLERTTPQLVLLDINLRGPEDGIALAKEIRDRQGPGVIFLTAFADEATISRAAAVLPHGYLIKPYNERTLLATLQVALRRLAESRRPSVRRDRTAAASSDRPSLERILLGRSPAMQKLRHEVAQLARFSSTVLIEGETGTGKECVARALHHERCSSDQPFISVNCAALTETLASSELFGHRRGAFTGAINEHKGVFEAAHGGTLLLDEIGDLPRSQQPLLLRVLEQREVLRVGETIARKIDVRVIAATNRHLEDDVRTGRFRADLYYRLRVGRILLPPLRERPEDIDQLSHAFLGEFSERNGGTPLHLDDSAAQLLAAYPWPGNVRELRNCMEYASIRAMPPRIGIHDLPPEIQAYTPTLRTPELDSQDWRQRVVEALRRTDGNRSEAARLLGISRATFYRKLEELGLDEAT